MPENWIEAASNDEVPEQGTMQVNCGSETICLYKIGDIVY